MAEKQDYTQEQLTKLREAYASGVLEFRFGNEKTVYRSAQEMLETIRIIERSLGLSERKVPKALSPTFGKGL